MIHLAKADIQIIRVVARADALKQFRMLFGLHGNQLTKDGSSIKVEFSADLPSGKEEKKSMTLIILHSSVLDSEKLHFQAELRNLFYQGFPVLYVSKKGLWGAKTLSEKNTAFEFKIDQKTLDEMVGIIWEDDIIFDYVAFSDYLTNKLFFEPKKASAVQHVEDNGLTIDYFDMPKFKD